MGKGLKESATVTKMNHQRVPRPALVLAAGLVSCLVALSGCNALRVIFPSSDHDEVAPELPDDLAHPAVLIFSKTNGFRHEEAIDAGVPALEIISQVHDWNFYSTENGAIHNAEQLDRFDVVVWFQVSGDVLDEDQRTALQDWIGKGGAFFGVHGTGGDPDYDWSWHPETLVGAQFIGHPMGPQFQTATIRIESPNHPALSHLGSKWERIDEWYSFEKSPRRPGVDVLATLDESTYAPDMKMLWMDKDLRMGADHPIIWTHCIGRGRSLYSALGHQAEAYSEAKHLKFLETGIAWLMDDASKNCNAAALR